MPPSGSANRASAVRGRDGEEVEMRVPDEFYRITRDQPPWPLMIRAASRVNRGEMAPTALDLGCGAGRDTRYLLAHGFHVTAVDESEAALAYLRNLPSERLRVVRASFEDFAFDAGAYDLISAQFSLPFIRPDAFPGVFARMKAALHPGGIFAVQFFGVNDQWNREGRPMTFVTRHEAEALLSGLDTLAFEEEDKDGTIADGSPKHWHVFHSIARRPA